LDKCRLIKPGPATSAFSISPPAADVELVDDRLRDLARRLAELLAQLHREVGLVVAERRVPRRVQQRVGVGVVGPERRGQRVG